MRLLDKHDHEMLAILNGDAELKFWGAWVTATCESLKEQGYAEGLYKISDKGKQYMKEHPWSPPPESTGEE